MGNATKKHKSSALIIKAAVCAAGFMVASFVAGVNTMPAFAAGCKQIPGISGLVSIVEFDKGSGTGGEITDGQELGEIIWARDGASESITLKLLAADVAEIPGVFRGVEERYPHRLVLTLNGIRGVPATDFVVPRESALLQGVDRLITLDDSAQRIVLTFTKPVKFVMATLRDPARIYITFQKRESQDQPRVYSLRTASYEASESIAVQEEILLWEHGIDTARSLYDVQGSYLVEAGYYVTMEEAASSKANLEKLLDIPLFIETRGESDIPGYIKN